MTAVRRPTLPTHFYIFMTPTPQHSYWLPYKNIKEKDLMLASDGSIINFEWNKSIYYTREKSLSNSHVLINKLITI